MTKIYIAGAITAEKHTDMFNNISKGIKTASDFLKAGFAPFCPFLDYQFLFYNNIEVQKFYDYSIEFLKACDVVFVLKGYGFSKGTVEEIKVAHDKGILIVYQEDFGTFQESVKHIKYSLFGCAKNDSLKEFAEDSKKNYNHDESSSQCGFREAIENNKYWEFISCFEKIHFTKNTEYLIMNTLFTKACISSDVRFFDLLLKQDFEDKKILLEQLAEKIKKGKTVGFLGFYYKKILKAILDEDCLGFQDTETFEFEAEKLGNELKLTDKAFNKNILSQSLTFSYNNDSEIPIIEKVSSCNPLLANMANAALDNDLNLFKSFAVPYPELVEEYKEPLFHLSLQSTKFFEANVFGWLIKAHKPNYWLLKNLIKAIENFKLKSNLYEYQKLKNLLLGVNLNNLVDNSLTLKDKINKIKKIYSYEIKEFNGFDFIVYKKMQFYDCCWLKDKYEDGEVIKIKFRDKKNPLRKLFQELREDLNKIKKYEFCLINENQKAIEFFLNSLK